MADVGRPKKVSADEQVYDRYNHGERLTDIAADMKLDELEVLAIVQDKERAK